MEITQKIDLQVCPKCSMTHFNLEIIQLETKIENFTHRTTCPFKNEDFYLTINTH